MAEEERATVVAWVLAAAAVVAAREALAAARRCHQAGCRADDWEPGTSSAIQGRGGHYTERAGAAVAQRLSHHVQGSRHSQGTDCRLLKE